TALHQRTDNSRCEDRFTDGMRGPVTANWIERDRGRAACQPIQRTERGRDSCERREPAGRRAKTSNLRGNQLTATERSFGSSSNGQKPPRRGRVGDQEQPTILQGLDPANAGIR